MIVIGVDVHKHLLTAVAVDEVGRRLSQWTGPLDAQLLAWAKNDRSEAMGIFVPPAIRHPAVAVTRRRARVTPTAV
jgi:hypothetical protein